MKKRNATIVAALISAVAVVIAAFIGGHTVATSNIMSIIESNTSVIINEGESTGEVIKSLLRQTDDLRETIREKDITIADLNSEIDKLTNENKEQANSADSKSQDYEEQLNELRGTIQGKEAEINRLQTLCDEMKTEQRTLEAELKKTEEELENLQKKYNDAIGVVTLPSGGVDLTLLDIFNRKTAYWSINSGDKEDTLGSDYSMYTSYIRVGGHQADWSITQGHAEYFIDGKYTQLVGNIAPHKDAWGSDTAKIKIWGRINDSDKEILLYESPSINVRTSVFSFEIGGDLLANIRFLRIVHDGSVNIPLLLTGWTLS